MAGRADSHIPPKKIVPYVFHVYVKVEVGWISGSSLLSLVVSLFG